METQDDGVKKGTWIHDQQDHPPPASWNQPLDCHGSGFMELSGLPWLLETMQRDLTLVHGLSYSRHHIHSYNYVIIQTKTSQTTHLQSQY